MAFYVGAANVSTDASATTQTASNNLRVRPGDLVLAFSKWEGLTTTDTISDSVGSVYAKASEQVRNTNNNDQEAVWHAGIVRRGSNNLSITQTLGASRPFRRLGVVVFRPRPGYRFLLTRFGGTSTFSSGSTGPGSGNFTPHGIGVAVGGVAEYDVTTYTPGSGWTEAIDANILVEYRLLNSVTGPINADATSTASMQWIAIGVSVLEVPQPHSTPFGIPTPIALAAFSPPAGAYILTCNVGTYTLNGVAANTLVGRLLTADAGSYALTGVSANVLKGYLLTANAGSYALVGLDASLLKTWLLSGAAGSYSLTGVDATLTYNAGTNSYTLVCDAGAYTLSGQDAATLVTYLLTASAGSYTLTGQAANTLAGRLLTADAGSYALTGVAANTLKTYLITGDPGSYTITGMPSTLNYSGEAPVTTPAQLKALGLSLMRLGGIR